MSSVETASCDLKRRKPRVDANERNVKRSQSGRFDAAVTVALRTVAARRPIIAIGPVNDAKLDRKMPKANAIAIQGSGRRTGLKAARPATSCSTLPFQTYSSPDHG